tara:strand:+ start:20 stop:244 length:225 start_codon:yes stop_codon:yes gene_type:complete
LKKEIKVNGSISMGNILVIVTMVVSIAIGWATMNTSIQKMNGELSLKAEKDVVDTHFIYIQKQLDEIKTMIKEK